MPDKWQGPGRDADTITGGARNRAKGDGLKPSATPGVKAVPMGTSQETGSLWRGLEGGRHPLKRVTAYWEVFAL